jgi:glutaconate CoA-transferase subunit A
MSIDAKKSKVMSLKEAVSQNIQSGCSIGIANFLSSGPYAIIHEIIRQGIKDLTVYSTSTIAEQDMLVAGGCVKRIATAYSHRFSTARNGTAVERAIRKKEIEYEEFSNYAISQMFQAGAMGLPFMPMLPAIGVTDIFNKRTWMGENKMKWIDCPFTGKKMVAVPAINPDVAILHAQRADKYGNIQYYGTMSCVRDIALASKRIIVTVEEIVETDVIKLSPFNTIIPGFRVNAVVECPLGAHPVEVLGYYGLDYGWLAQFFLDQMSKISLKKFIQKWILDVPDHESYVELLIEEYGQDSIDRLKARMMPSSPVNMGTPGKSMWCERDGQYTPWIGKTKEEYIEYMKEKLKMYKMEDSK